MVEHHFLFWLPSCLGPLGGGGENLNSNCCSPTSAIQFASLQFSSPNGGTDECVLGNKRG